MLLRNLINCSPQIIIIIRTKNSIYGQIYAKINVVKVDILSFNQIISFTRDIIINSSYNLRDFILIIRLKNQSSS